MNERKKRPPLKATTASGRQQRAGSGSESHHLTLLALRTQTPGMLCAIIDIKASQWLGTERKRYLRPATLFAPGKLENYLSEVYQNRHKADRARGASRPAETTANRAPEGATHAHANVDRPNQDCQPNQPISVNCSTSAGFTQKVLAGTLQAAGFASVASAQRGAPFFDLWAVASKAERSEEALRALAAEHFPT